MNVLTDKKITLLKLPAFHIMIHLEILVFDWLTDLFWVECTSGTDNLSVMTTSLSVASCEHIEINVIYARKDVLCTIKVFSKRRFIYN